ncbi:39S ribosomal protein L14, mitochondrial isoform X2 [Apis laboriosa]|uniref:39S ribosomal protein L14, mitochondrial isoform X2 n=1 Tax=Apis laboriosa TaxID=183418 RepID=UPI001CC8209E|nr:39S ribosomal protein L14, mitochondrial isoform X2 [Apis laboriosa]
MPIYGTMFNILSRNVSTSTICNQIIKLTRLRVVDNSEIGKQAMMEGKPPRCIHVYNKKGVGYIGDRVLVAIKGEKKKVLIDDNGTPLGTRIHVPIPHILRTIMKEKTHSKGADYTKLLAIATKFV